LIRAGNNTISAADTFILINPDNAILTLLAGACGTNIYAGRIFTLIASYWNLGYLWFAMVRGGNFDQSWPGNTYREKMLIAAGGNTTVTPHALR